MLEIVENKERPALRYVLYVRKSSEDDKAQVKSLEDQIADCLSYAKIKGLVVVDTIQESASAKKSKNRPLFTQMLKDISKKKYDGILAWHPDRLSRNSLESGMIVDMIDNDIIKDLKFPTLEFTNNASGKLLLNIMFAMSKQYSEHLSENVRRGVKTNLELGKSAGIRKWGYVRNSDTGLYEPDENFDYIRHCWDILLDGGTQSDALKYLKLHDVHAMTKKTERNKIQRRIELSKSTMSRIFSDPFYYGVLIQNGTPVDLRLVTPNFVPMITQEEYALVQDKNYTKARRVHPLLENNKTDEEQVFIPLKKFIKCKECGKFMYAGRSKSSNKQKYYLYYHCGNKECNHSRGRVRGSEIFDQIVSVLDQMKYSKADYDKYVKDSEEYINKKLNDLKTEQLRLNAVKSNKLKVVRELSLQYSSLHADPKTPKVVLEDINVRLETIQNDIIEIDDEMSKIESKIFNPDDLRMTRDNFSNLVNMAADKMRAGSALEKDMLARRIFSNLDLDLQKRVSYHWRAPFNFIAENSKISLGWG